MIYGSIWVDRGEKNNVQKVNIIISDTDLFLGLYLGDPTTGVYQNKSVVGCFGLLLVAGGPRDPCFLILRPRLRGLCIRTYGRLHLPICCLSCLVCFKKAPSFVTPPFTLPTRVYLLIVA